MKNAILLGLAIGGALLIVGIVSVNRHSDVTLTTATESAVASSVLPPSTPLTITAQQLGEAYSLIGGNPNHADQEYEGKKLVLSGTIWLNFLDGTGRMAFKTNGNAIGVTCWFDGNAANILSQAKEGQSIVVAGQCDGLGGGEVHMTSCSVVRLEELLPPMKHKHRVGPHHVIYKTGEYHYRPEWMTQSQWDSYIDWEAKQ